MSEPRFWLVDALSSEDTSTSNRVHEVTAAATYDVLGLVDEKDGGVIGYLHAEHADYICNRLNGVPEDEA